MSLTFLQPVVAAAEATRTEVRADIRPAPTRAGRSYFRIRPVTAPPVVARPSRTVQHPAKPVRRAVKAPKRIEAAPRRKRATTTAYVPAAVTGSISVVIRFALAQVGKRYVWGTSGPSTYDCSGLIMASFARIGIRLPHQSGGIAGRGRYIPAGQWLPGDVLTFPGHVALYLGGGLMIEAANPRAGVRIASVKGRGGSARRMVG